MHGNPVGEESTMASIEKATAPCFLQIRHFEGQFIHRLQHIVDYGALLDLRTQNLIATPFQDIEELRKVFDFDDEPIPHVEPSVAIQQIPNRLGRAVWLLDLKVLGDRKREHCSLGGPVLYPGFPTMSFGDFLHDGQSQTGALRTL
jgi:hypothetical protein